MGSLLELIQSTSSGLVIRVSLYPKMIASGLSTLVRRGRFAFWERV
jgi:hypothetical protein